MIAAPPLVSPDRGPPHSDIVPTAAFEMETAPAFQALRFNVQPVSSDP